MKAILVIEMPKNCLKCPLGKNMSIAIETCIQCPIGKCVIDEEVMKKPDWCPLRPVPEKKQTTDDFWQGCVNIVRNHCIDEILGDKE